MFPIFALRLKQKRMRAWFYIVSTCLAALCLLPGLSRAEENTSVLVQNYTINDYQASCQNWDIAISYRGWLYVANNSGLLEFDGNTWTLHPLPDRSRLFRLSFSNDTVYSRGESGDGYWTRDAMGKMHFTAVESPYPDTLFRTDTLRKTCPAEVLKDKPLAYASTNRLDLVGTERGGLYILDKEGRVVHHVYAPGLLQDNMVYNIEVQDDKLVWLALDNGIAQVDINPPLYMLGKRNSVGQLYDAELIDSTLYIRTNRGCFRRSLRSNDVFVGVSEKDVLPLFTEKKKLEPEKLPTMLQDIELTEAFVHPEYIYPVRQGLYWLVKGNEAGLFATDEGKGRLKCRILFDNYNLNLATQGHQVIPFNDTLCVISSMQGVFLLNTQDVMKSMTQLTMPSFRRISYTDNAGLHELPTDTSSITLPHDFQKVNLQVGTTIFTPNHQICYRIEGVTSGWSEWQKSGKISFFQLPSGEYDLRVRKYVAKGIYPELTLHIDVRPPWYKTVYAYIGYLVLAWFILRIGIRIYLRNLRQKEEARKAQKQRDEEHREAKMKNEMLEAELRNKDTELMMQTTALVKRNQAVQTILEEFEKQKETLGDRYPNKLYTKLHTLMEETMENKADWILFESYFNSAHHNFLDRLRQQYSDLTTGDLRICCLLRMNLSTKEIASLMNVSVRAIELRRYRLRKRLGLEGETNLVDFLMNF